MLYIMHHNIMRVRSYHLQDDCWQTTLRSFNLTHVLSVSWPNIKVGGDITSSSGAVGRRNKVKIHLSGMSYRGTCVIFGLY